MNSSIHQRVANVILAVMIVIEVVGCIWLIESCNNEMHHKKDTNVIVK